MNKIRFGTRDVIAAVAATIIYLLFEQIKYIWPHSESLQFVSNMSELCKDMVLMVSAAAFGPIVATVSIVGTKVLEIVVNGADLDLLRMAIWIFVGILVGCYQKQYGVLEGQFRGLKIVDYIVILISSNVVSFILMEPLIGFFFFDRELVAMIKSGRSFAIGNIIVSGIIGTLVMIGISRVCESKRQTK